MKLLKIEESLGYYLNDVGGYMPVDKLTKDDILRLASRTLGEEVEFDDYDDKSIKNQAHQIIYKNVYEKLRGLGERRQEFIDESERLYLKEYEKYREEPPPQGD